MSFVAVQQCMAASRPTLNVITWLSLVTSLWICAILCGQLGLVAGETTTFQVIKFQNYGVDMWTARGLRNVWQFLSSGHFTVTPLVAGSNSSRSKAGRGAGKDSAPEHRCGSQHCSHNHGHSGSGALPAGGELDGPSLLGKQDV